MVPLCTTMSCIKRADWQYHLACIDNNLIVRHHVTVHTPVTALAIANFSSWSLQTFQEITGDWA